MNQVPPQKPAEDTVVHTRIMRFQLGVEESRSYWEHVQDASEHHSSLDAFEHRWFGSASQNRTKIIMRNMRARYDDFPPSLSVLSQWSAMEPRERTTICHWHLQLSDPLYRTFTGDYLVERREYFAGELTRERVAKWVEEQQPKRWSANTRTMVASKLLTAAHSAGLVANTSDPRELVYPRVPDRALSYLLHLLREVEFAGTVVDNPYLVSVGLTDSFLDEKLRGIGGLEIRRMGDLIEFASETPDLTSWGEMYT